MTETPTTYTADRIREDWNAAAAELTTALAAVNKFHDIMKPYENRHQDYLDAYHAYHAVNATQIRGAMGMLRRALEGLE
jgi:hypothetical protein